jgi:hypothetical protein
MLWCTVCDFIMILEDVVRGDEVVDQVYMCYNCSHEIISGDIEYYEDEDG